MTCAVDMRLPNYLQGDGTQEFLPYHLPCPMSAYRNSAGRFRGADGRLWVMTFVSCSVWTPPGAGSSGSYCGRPSVDVYLEVQSKRPAGCAADATLRPGRPQARAEGAIREIGEKVPLRNPGAARLPIRRQNRSRRVALRQGQQGADRNCAMLLAILVHPVRSSGLAREAHCL